MTKKVTRPALDSKDSLLFSQIRIAVVGDSMLDRFIVGSVHRISPEAPVPIILFEKETLHAGGAANVAHNVVSLGGKSTLISIVGQDDAGKILLKTLHESNVDTSYIERNETILTIEKIRLIAHGQHMLRVDKEKNKLLTSKIEQKIIKAFIPKISTFRAVIFSDYAKGFLTKNIVKAVKHACKKNNIPTIVAPKPENINLFKGVTLIIVNYKESVGITREKDFKVSAKIMNKKYDSSVVITLGERGMYLYHKNKGYHIPTQAREVFDVSGAGDTVIATVSLCIAKGYDMFSSAKIANIAAGIVVGKSGTATVTHEELLRFIK